MATENFNYLQTVGFIMMKEEFKNNRGFNKSRNKVLVLSSSTKNKNGRLNVV